MRDLRRADHAARARQARPDSEVLRRRVPCASSAVLPRRKGRVVTKADQIRELRTQGMGYGAIAKRLGVTKNGVADLCRRMGLSGYRGAPAPSLSRGRLPNVSRETNARRRRRFVVQASTNQ
jgi:hypothetical protein